MKAIPAALIGSLLSSVAVEPGDNTIEITLRDGNSIEGEVLGLPDGSQATIHAPAPGEYRVSYQTRPDPDGIIQSYGMYNQRLEGIQTFHLGDFESEGY